MALVTCISNTLNGIQKKTIIFKSRQKNKSRFIPFNHADQTVIIKENGIKFELNLTRYLDIGLFIDHRLTREWVMRHSKNRHVLNLFSYTGSFSCYALAGQASQVTSVDLSPTYSRWHERHCKINGFDPSRHQIICADVHSFLNQDLKTYDMIICDPPSFSHSKRNGVSRFQIQDNGRTLLLSCLDRLSPTGTLLFSTNYRGFNMEKLCLPPMYMIKEVSRQFCPKDFQNKPHTRTWMITTNDPQNVQI
jgi:23S rRNA G2069 N7-methylase RlmK/C1962 C5-methylase RlmI